MMLLRCTHVTVHSITCFADVLWLTCQGNNGDFGDTAPQQDCTDHPWIDASRLTVRDCYSLH